MMRGISSGGGLQSAAEEKRLVVAVDVAKKLEGLVVVMVGW